MQLIKLNDNFVQSKYKEFLKLRSNDTKKENVYERLNKHAQDKV